MKKIAILFLMVCSAALGWSQGAEQMIENVEQIGQRKLVVIVEEPDSKLIEKWEKKGLSGDLSKLKDAMASYNNNLKEVVEKFWEYKTNGIEYMTYRELEQKNGNYVVLRCINMGISDANRPFTFSKLLWEEHLEKYSAAEAWEGAAGLNTALSISLIEDLNSRPMFMMPMPDILPTKTDFIYGVRMTCAVAKSNLDDLKKNKKAKGGNGMQLYKEYAKKLKDKTLLIREDWLRNDLNKETVAKVYPYKFEILSKEKLDDLLMQKDPQYAVAIIISYQAGTSKVYTQQVMDCENGSLLCVSYPKVSVFSGAEYRYITEKNLKDYINGY